MRREPGEVDHDGPRTGILQRAEEGGAVGPTLVAVVTLGLGTNRWSLEHGVGEIGGLWASGPFPVGEQLLHVWIGASRTYVLTPLAPDDAGRIGSTTVPAGSGRIVHLDRPALEAAAADGWTLPDRWPALRDVEVVVGESLELELP